MRYKIKDIPAEGQLVSQPLPAAILAQALDGTDAELGACGGELRLQLFVVGEDVLVTGQLSGELVLPCALCLKPASVPLDLPLNMTFQPEGSEAPGVEDEDLADDLDYGHHDGQWLDLEETLRELLILSLPISPRCQESCAGLCPGCGANRNDPPACACANRSESSGDPRLQALKNLKLQS